MGFLRLWFASIVAMGHAGWGMIPPMLSGELAVQSFFVLSGFYIQLCLGAYQGQPHWIRKFYASRIWRLFPLYYIFLVLTAIFVLRFHHSPSAEGAPAIAMFEQGNVLTIAAWLWTNLFIIGQDVLRFMFVGSETGQLYFSLQENIPVTHWGSGLALVGQAWTLSLELMFYLLAPWLLLRKTRLLLVIAALSFALKLALWQTPLYAYSNRGCSFFPCELWLFLAGSIICRMVKAAPSLADHAARKWMYAALLGVVIGNSLLYPYLTTPGTLFPGLSFLLPFIPAVYFLARLSRGTAWDRWMGELSYPVYISHVLIIGVLEVGGVSKPWLAVVTVAVSIAVSVLLVRLIEEPLSAWRHRAYRAHTADTIRN